MMDFRDFGIGFSRPAEHFADGSVFDCTMSVGINRSIWNRRRIPIARTQFLPIIHRLLAAFTFAFRPIVGLPF